MTGDVHWLLPLGRSVGCGASWLSPEDVTQLVANVTCDACRYTNAFRCAVSDVRDAAVGLTKPTSYKLDAGKLRWALLPWGAVELVVQVLTVALAKYPPDGWKNVPNAKERYFDALQRHLVAWRKGEKLDPDDGLPHMAHAACDVLFILAFDQKTDGVSEEEANK